MLGGACGGRGPPGGTNTGAGLTRRIGVPARGPITIEPF